MAETQNNSKVNVHEVTKLTPFSSNSASATPFTLPLTYFDTYWFKFPPVERLFFYQITELTSDSFNSVLLPKLKHSLSLTLLHYPPLAGHLMWPSDTAKPAIYYFPNDGVSLKVAESNSDFALLSGSGIREAAEFNPLVPQLSISDDRAEVIAIQITFFPNQGFSIGISYHHSLLDGKSSIMFIKSWAYMCKQIQSLEVHNVNPSLLPELSPCFDRTVIKDPDGIDMVYVKHWMDFTGSSNTRSLKVLPTAFDTEASTKLVRKTFELSCEDIKKLRDKINKINNEVGESKQLHLSTFVLTCAHAYDCLIKTKRPEVNTTVGFAIAGDCRGRLDPPIPINYFGNCVGAEMAEASKSSDVMRANGIVVVAEKLSEMIIKLKGNAVQGSEDKIIKTFAMLKRRGQLTLTVAGSNRFDAYGSDFGWGRPKKVEIVSIDRTGAISLAESKDGDGGVEIGVVLKKQQMEVFASLFVNGLNDL